jgi:hypothetical protein
MNAPRRQSALSDLPAPWQIVEGPHLLSQNAVDGRAWRLTLQRGHARRPVIVVVTREALMVDRLDLLPVPTREAILTDGRSEAARVAQFDDDARCVVLGRHGHQPAPLSLTRLAQR